MCSVQFASVCIFTVCDMEGAKKDREESRHGGGMKKGRNAGGLQGGRA